MKKYYIFLFLAAILFSCEENIVEEPITQSTASAKIIIFSDPHLYVSILGTPIDTGQFAMFNPRMIMESESLLKEAVNIIKMEAPDIVIVPGDLTNNGEMTNHLAFADYMTEIENAGIKVYVIPGNHDILNPESKSYVDGHERMEPNITASDFENIYKQFGYEEAVAKDNYSLSYIAEPIEDLWILGMDACRYDENESSGRAIVGARFKPETISWIKDQLKRAKEQGKLVLGTLHHGILEHFTDQKLYPFTSEFVVDDWENLSTEFMQLGLKIVFTGHYHSNDIVKAQQGVHFLFDIETGSLASYSNSYRIINLTEGNNLDIQTKDIQNIDYDTDGKPFQDYSHSIVTTSLTGIAKMVMMDYLQFNQSLSDELSPSIAKCFVNNYKGDEKPFPESLVLQDSLNQNPLAVSLRLPNMIEDMTNDLAPEDNNITIDLSTGEVTK